MQLTQIPDGESGEEKAWNICKTSKFHDVCEIKIQ